MSAETTNEQLNEIPDEAQQNPVNEIEPLTDIPDVQAGAAQKVDEQPVVDITATKEAQQNYIEKKVIEDTPKLEQISAGKLQNDILITLNQKISEYSLVKSHLNSLPPLESYNTARESLTGSLGSLKAGIDGILHQLGNSEIV